MKIKNHERDETDLCFGILTVFVTISILFVLLLSFY